MTINNFNPNVSHYLQSLDLQSQLIHQNQPLDLRVNPTIQTQPLDLRVNRVWGEALNLYANDEKAMDISEPIDLSRNGSATSLQVISQSNHSETSTSRLSVSLKKKIIDSARRDSNGKIISLYFCKKFKNQIFFLEELIKHLDEILDRSDIYTTVKKISLEDNNLSKLPKGINKFTNLECINLSKNLFINIPDQIYRFKNLKKLYFESNRLNKIDHNIIKLRKLTDFRVGSNFISYISPQIGLLRNLCKLQLNNNLIAELPREFFKLRNLQLLDLSFNRLRKLPKRIKNLYKLENFQISSNFLSSIPAEVFGEKLEVLDVSDNNIDLIPSTIRNSPQLESIDFQMNDLEAIPEEIGNLRYLRRAWFNDNLSLTYISSTIFNLSSECRIDVHNSGLAISTLSRLQDRITNPDYNGPMIEFSIKAAERRLNETLLSVLYSRAKKTPLNSFDNIKNIESLEPWLRRLDWMADFQNPRKNPELPGFLIDCIEYAETNERYREIFSNIIEDAATACGDRMALSILDIDIAKTIVALLESKKLQELTNFLIQTVFPRQILQSIATRKIATLTDIVDQIEIYLAYPVRLKERLGLSIHIEDMLFYQLSHITEEELEAAAIEVERQLVDKKVCAKFLIENTYWMELIEQLYPEEYKRINERTVDILEQSIETAKEYRLTRLIALSGITL